MKKVIFIAGVLMFCGAAEQAWATSYMAIDLNSDGLTESYAHGTSGNQQVGEGHGSATGGHYHALLWNGSAGNYIDLTPSGFSQTRAYGISGNQQVGRAAGLSSRAILWNGSATDYVDLTPSGFFYCYASGISGNQQVGWGSGSATEEYCHALLWNGSAASYVDLNPSGFTDSYAAGISGNQQVGAGINPATENNFHALLWKGSAASCVDLTPSGFWGSYAHGISGNQQVGWGWGYPGTENPQHALLWNGSAADYVDLNPSGFTGSTAIGISGNQQVGWGWGSATGYNDHALLWNGSAANYVDLHQFVPTGFISSYAESIDSYGNIAGYGYDSSGNYHAIVWSVPEPATIGVMKITPQTINRKSNQPRIQVVIRLPDNCQEDIDTGKLLAIYPGEIKAKRQSLSAGNGICAEFEKDDLMAAVPNGDIELKVVGKLKSGREFQGTDTVKIIH